MTTKKPNVGPKGGKPEKGKAPGPAVPKTPVEEITAEQQIIGARFLGKVSNYYSHLHVFAVVLEAPLALGDAIRIKGHTTDLTQKVEHMQVDHLNVQSAAPGEAAAIQAADKVRLGDAVYKI
ncbi:MAG: translation elongation factor-like protein [Elusimicrobia bacterium]|nr:translation elongation factor-like protein [Elusimicrobiota bacterium]